MQTKLELANTIISTRLAELHYTLKHEQIKLAGLQLAIDNYSAWLNTGDENKEDEQYDDTALVNTVLSSINSCIKDKNKHVISIHKVDNAMRNINESYGATNSKIAKIENEIEKLNSNANTLNKGVLTQQHNNASQYKHNDVKSSFAGSLAFKIITGVIAGVIALALTAILVQNLLPAAAAAVIGTAVAFISAAIAPVAMNTAMWAAAGVGALALGGLGYSLGRPSVFKKNSGGLATPISGQEGTKDSREKLQGHIYSQSDSGVFNESKQAFLKEVTTEEAQDIGYDDHQSFVF